MPETRENEETMEDVESAENDVTVENSEQPEKKTTEIPVTFHGKFMFSNFLLCLTITIIFLVLIAAGLSSVLKAWLDSSGDEFSAVCGVWGSLIVMILGTVFFLFLEDNECDISFHEDRVEYRGWHYMRPEKKVTLGYDKIDILEFLQNEEGVLVGRYYELKLEDRRRERTMTKKNSICLYPGGFTKEEFIGICEALNTRLLDGMMNKEKMQRLRDDFGIFGKQNEELTSILENEYGSKRLKAGK